MKKKKIFYFFAILFMGGLIMISCEEGTDDNDDDDTSAEKTCYLTKIYQNDILSSEFTWNADNQLADVSEYDENGVNDFKMEITWTDGKVSKIQWNDSDEEKSMHSIWSQRLNGKLNKLGIKSLSPNQYNTFTYSDGKLTHSETYMYENDAWVKMGTENYEYTGDYVTKATFVYGDTLPVYNNVFTYDANGNMTEMRTNIIDEDGYDVLNYKSEYTYDDKKSLYSNNGLPIIMPFIVSPNNILTEFETQYVWGSTEIESTESTTMVYTYNEDDYPDSFVETDDDGSNNYSLEYDCSE